MRFEIYNLFDNDIHKIICIGYSNDINVTRFGPAKRNNYIIHYVLSGCGYFNNNRVTEGQGFLITPLMSETYFPDEKNPWEFIWIIFENDENIAEFFPSYNANAKTNIFKYNNFSALNQAKNLIINNSNKILRANELYEIFLHIFNNHNVPHEKEISRENIYYITQ